MSNILPRQSPIHDIQARYETADHTEEDFETLLTLSKTYLSALNNETVANFLLEMDNHFLRGGTID